MPRPWPQTLPLAAHSDRSARLGREAVISTLDGSGITPPDPSSTSMREYRARCHDCGWWQATKDAGMSDWIKTNAFSHRRVESHCVYIFIKYEVTP